MILSLFSSSFMRLQCSSTMCMITENCHAYLGDVKGIRKAKKKSLTLQDSPHFRECNTLNKSKKSLAFPLRVDAFHQSAGIWALVVVPR